MHCSYYHILLYSEMEDVLLECPQANLLYYYLRNLLRNLCQQHWVVRPSHAVLQVIYKTCMRHCAVASCWCLETSTMSVSSPSLPLLIHSYTLISVYLMSTSSCLTEISSKLSTTGTNGIVLYRYHTKQFLRMKCVSWWFFHFSILAFHLPVYVHCASIILTYAV